MRELADFLKQGLSDNALQLASFGRISCAIILYMMIVWESYLISKTGAWVDIPANWLILILAIWSVAKGVEAVQANIEAKNAKCPESPSQPTT
jgi:hypothetical protein